MSTWYTVYNNWNMGKEHLMSFIHTSKRPLKFHWKYCYVRQKFWVQELKYSVGKDWLINRTNRIVWNEKTSEHVRVTSGVPQGWVFGPILFMYINYLYLGLTYFDVYTLSRFRSNSQSLYLCLRYKKREVGEHPGMITELSKMTKTNS